MKTDSSAARVTGKSRCRGPRGTIRRAMRPVYVITGLGEVALARRRRLETLPTSAALGPRVGAVGGRKGAMMAAPAVPVRLGHAFTTAVKQPRTQAACSPA